MMPLVGQVGGSTDFHFFFIQEFLALLACYSLLTSAENRFLPSFIKTLAQVEVLLNTSRVSRFSRTDY